MAAKPASAGARSAFDRSLELHELRRAAQEYAARHGEPGSVAYRAAWVKFRQHIRSTEDLQRLRSTRARPKGSTQNVARARANARVPEAAGR